MIKKTKIDQKYQVLIKKVALALAILSISIVGIRLLFANLNNVVIALAFLLIVFYLCVYFWVGEDISERLSSWALATSTLLVITISCYYVGGITSPLITILPFVCVVSFLILRGKNGWFFSVLTVVSILIFMFLEYNDYRLPKNTLTEDQANMMRGFWLIFSTFMISITMHYFKQENTQLEEKLFEDSITDPLTGLYNRRFFEQIIPIEMSRIERNKIWLSVLLIDIDYFKLYNDTYGHQAGDKVLKQISKSLQNYFKRSQDTVIRFGGEEFLIILPETSFDDARELAEDFRIAVQKLNVLHSSSEYKTLTVSIGIHSVHGKNRGTVENLIKQADLALYESKKRGRNKIMPDALNTKPALTSVSD